MYSNSRLSINIKLTYYKNKTSSKDISGSLNMSYQREGPYPGMSLLNFTRQNAAPYVQRQTANSFTRFSTIANGFKAGPWRTTYAQSWAGAHDSRFFMRSMANPNRYMSRPVLDRHGLFSAPNQRSVFYDQMRGGRPGFQCFVCGVRCNNTMEMQSHLLRHGISNYIG